MSESHLSLADDVLCRWSRKPRTAFTATRRVSFHDLFAAAMRVKGIHFHHSLTSAGILIKKKTATIHNKWFLSELPLLA